MPEGVEEQFAMASLYAAKQQLRSAMKHKLRAVSHESILSQSMRFTKHKYADANADTKTKKWWI